MRRLFALLLVSLVPPGARAEIIERVVAKVNGQIITLSEFQSRQIAAAQGARVTPENVGAYLRQNNARILQEAIDEILILQKAEDAGIKAPSQWVDESIEGIRKDNNITTDEQFQDALAREGLTLPELRQNIERGVVRRIIMQRDIQPKIEAAETELRAEYEKLKATEFTKPATVTLQEILVKEDAGGAALARQVAERARAGEDFAALATTYSSAPSRAHGGDVGQVSQGEIDPALGKVAFELAVGGVSDPIAVDGGYRVIKVTAKTSGSTTPYEAAKDKVHDRLMMARFEKAYEAYMQELRQSASIELRVREVPLQLTGPIPEGSLRDALEPLAPGAPPAEPAPPPAPGAAGVTVTPTEKAPGVPAPADEEITTTPQAGPEKVAPPPPPAVPPPKDAPPGR
ncbi:MAG TPA: peptidyl-prolyl cis-trans isomerase [Vicinamibacteria bacterium]|nr:peptidyl-prolyl cis-trans isomerase [Vicinamibacteria bacterium]